jgi:hypothetical protein
MPLEKLLQARQRIILGHAHRHKSIRLQPPCGPHLRLLAIKIPPPCPLQEPKHLPHILQDMHAIRFKLLRTSQELDPRFLPRDLLERLDNLLKGFDVADGLDELSVVFCGVEEHTVDDVAVIVEHGGEADAFRGVAPAWGGEGEVPFFVGVEGEAAEG